MIDSIQEDIMIYFNVFLINLSLSYLHEQSKLNLSLLRSSINELSCLLIFIYNTIYFNMHIYHYNSFTNSTHTLAGIAVVVLQRQASTEKYSLYKGFSFYLSKIIISYCTENGLMIFQQ